MLHRRDFPLIPISHGRYLAEHIPGAKLVELAGTEQSLFWETPELVLDHVEQFLTGVRRVAQPTRVLATVLFTDIVGSTQRAGELGDRRWRELLSVHDELTGRLVEEFGGRLVKSTGDGILARFESPTRAVRCALAMCAASRRLGVELRAAIHTGEIEERGSDIGGIGVHIASRVLTQAPDGRVVVTRTVRDLATGADLAFEPLGSVELRGVPGEWELFAATQR